MTNIVVWYEGYNANVYNQNSRDITQMWRETAQALGADNVYVINSAGVSDVDWRDFDNVTVYPSLEALEADVGGNYVYMEHGQTLTDAGVSYTNLRDYVHQDNTTYVAGPDSGLSILEGRHDKTWITIDANESLWSIIALTAVLYDKISKAG